MRTKRRRWRRSPSSAIERLPLSPAARLTGAASESASSARDKVFARLPWDPVLHVTVTVLSGPGVVRLCEKPLLALAKLRTNSQSSMLRTNGAFRNLGEDTMASILLMLGPRDIAHLIVACVAAARCAASVLSPSLRPLVSITLRIFLLGATARTPRCHRALARRVIDFDFLRRYIIFEHATAEGCAFLAQLCPSPRITVGYDVTQVDKDVWTLAGQRGAERMTRICAFGEVQHYVGERGAERKVREQYLHGTAVRHYEGERGAECKVRVTYRIGTVVHFEGERGVASVDGAVDWRVVVDLIIR